MMGSQDVIKAVTPAPGFRRDRVAGVLNRLIFLNSGFRRNDTKPNPRAFSEMANVSLTASERNIQP